MFPSTVSLPNIIPAYFPASAVCALNAFLEHMLVGDDLSLIPMPKEGPGTHRLCMRVTLEFHGNIQGDGVLL